MLETTQNVNLFLPILFSLFASYGTGSLLGKSLYIGALRSKNIPILQRVPPKKNLDITAGDMMSHPVKSMHFVSSVNQIS